MTYISRGTRIIVSRWLDECDAEYKLRACRKRSDGRLKRHTSCHDLRAWSNSECVNHAYLLDLMSDGESTGKSHVRLYGRYIPVPLLLKIFQGFNEGIIEEEFREDATRNNESGNMNGTKEKQNSWPKKSHVTTNVPSGSNNNEDSIRPEITFGTQADSSAENDENLWKIQCEKYLLEKRFSECRSLLCRAVEKLEKIDGIICDGLNECDNRMNEEKELTAREAKSLLCNCSKTESRSCSNVNSKLSLKKIPNTSKCTELQRKISDLTKKLKIINNKHHNVSEEMQKISQCGSGQQVTELYSRRDELKLKQLQKKLDKLVIRKGPLLLELIKTIKALKSLKNPTSKSKSRISFTSRGSLPVEELQCGVPVTCTCGWQCTDNVDSNSLALGNVTSQDNCSTITRKTDLTFTLENSDRYSPRKLDKYNTNSKDLSFNENWQTPVDGTINNFPNQDRSYKATTPSKSNTPNIKVSPGTKTDTNLIVGKDRGVADRNTKQDTTKLERKSKLKFVCPQPPCRKKSLSENLDHFHAYFLEDQQQEQPPRGNPIANISNPRPYTSPSATQQPNSRSQIPERKIKSETTMEEIEKTLRNYEQRLKSLDSLECKIKKMKEKLSEGNRQREEWTRQIMNSRKSRAAEREQSNWEIAKLCSENWALKKKVQDLMEKTIIQTRKIECFKQTKKKLKEIECESENLKKELSEYQNTFQSQKNQICYLEKYVVNQWTQIEKLNKLINKLSANSVKCFQDRSVQRSRSYSPESIKTTKTFSRSSGQGTRFSLSSEEEESSCCDEWRQQEMKSQQRISGSACCSSPPSIRRRGRCVN